MGFECAISKIPIVDVALTPAQTLAVYLYAEHVQKLKGPWYKEQIAKGITFEFDACDNIAQKYLVSSTQAFQRYLEIFDDVSKTPPTLLDFWCSIGQRFHHKIRQLGTPVFPELNGYGDYYYFTQESLETLLKQCQDWLDANPIVPVIQMDAYHYNKDDSRTSFKADGAYVTLRDHMAGHVEFDEYTSSDSPLLFDTSGDSEYRFAVERLAIALRRALDVVDTHLIVYCGG